MGVRKASVATRLRAAADAIDTAVGPVFDVLREIDDALSAVASPFTTESLAGVRAVAQHHVAGNTGWIAGTGYVSAIGVLADMPRWLEWWIAGPYGPQPLRVELDPRVPDFYDYTSAEWFRRPHGSGSTSVTGPYVDVRGTNAYTVTVSMPVARDDGTFIGVAAADLYLSGLEQRLLPALHEVAEPVVLTNDVGRVIATTDWRYLPGELLDVATAAAIRNCARLPWQVSVSGS